MKIAAPEFDYIRNFVRKQSAIVLEDGKEYLVESRLLPVMKGEGIASFEELVSKLKMTAATADLSRKVVEAMTTNETYFFRDIHPFQALKTDILPDMLAKRRDQRTLSIWCAASSTGQEPYSIAMTLCDHATALAGWKVSILATDLSTPILARAKAAKYSQLEVNRGLPAPLLVKYFKKEGLEWQLKDDIRNMVEYRQMNLDSPAYFVQPMDIVFIRNVLIYFETDVKRKILENIFKVLKPDGYLFLGAAETPLNIHDGFERLQVGGTVCYRRKR